MKTYIVKFEAVSKVCSDEAQVAVEVMRLLKDGFVKVVVEASS